MNFLQKLSLNYIPPSIATRDELGILREKIMQGILIMFFLLGTMMVVMGISAMFQTQNYVLALLYVGIYAVLIVNLVSRTLPYAIRGNITVILVYLLGVSELFESGQLGETRMYLLMFVALTSLLFNFKNIIAAIILSLAPIAAAGIYVDLTPEPAIAALANLREGTHWTLSSVAFLLFACVLGGATNYLITGIEKTYLRQEDLSRRLEHERNALEGRVQERTEAISRRLIQLRTAAEVTRMVGELTNPVDLLSQIVEVIRERFDLYYVGIFLIDPSGQFAILQAGSGEAGRRMLADGHRLAIGGNSMIGWSVANRKARIALDVGSDAVRFSNPNLPLTRSELALPITARDTSLGAMTVQSTQPNAFDQDDIEILQSLGDAIGIALDNDRQLRDTRQRLDETRLLNREQMYKDWTETLEMHGDLEYFYENTTEAILEAQEHVIEVPVVLRDEVIGYISLETDKETFSPEESALIDNITNQTAIALENARLLEATERRAIQEQKLNELATRFSRAITVDEILQAAVQELGQLPMVGEVSVQIRPAGMTSQPAGRSPMNGKGKEHTA